MAPRFFFINSQTSSLYCFSSSSINYNNFLLGVCFTICLLAIPTKYVPHFAYTRCVTSCLLATCLRLICIHLFVARLRVIVLLRDFDICLTFKFLS